MFRMRPIKRKTFSVTTIFYCMHVLPSICDISSANNCKSSSICIFSEYLQLYTGGKKRHTTVTTYKYLAYSLVPDVTQDKEFFDE